MISGPIATLYNSGVTSANFGFSVSRDGGKVEFQEIFSDITWSGYTGSLTPGASTTLLSNGFLSVGEAYSMTINQKTLTRNYDFGSEVSYNIDKQTFLWIQIQVTFNPIVGNYYPNQGDSVKFSCVKATEGTVVYEWDFFWTFMTNGRCIWATNNVFFSCGENAGSVVNDRCKAIILNVVVGTKTIEGTRFKVEIETSEYPTAEKV